mmetsp:Transcript_18192/g.38008  ORF Transcript_18192/g.38008 Transcript_18192/m.38008 type:complete len:510 (-) Transcript_18192:1996-3525(-)
MHSYQCGLSVMLLIAAFYLIIIPPCGAFRTHQMAPLAGRPSTTSTSALHPVVIHAKPSTRSTKSPSSLRMTRAARNAIEGRGMPSTPGWQSGRLNRLTDWATDQKPNRPIICEYDPKSRWLWTKWHGTVLKDTWKPVLAAMALALGIDYFVRRRFPTPSWSLLSVPAPSNPIIQRLTGLKKVWEYQLSLATFILTFFLSHAFSYWNKVYNTTRMIQGRINDFCMLLVMGAKRGTDADDDAENGGRHPVRSNASTGPKGSRGFSDESQEFISLCTRLIRLSHTFFWAQTATVSNGLTDDDEYIDDAATCHVPIDDEHIGPLLLSPYGLKALVDAGQLTQEEKAGLMGTGLPPNQYAYTLLVWVGVHCSTALRNGVLCGGAGYEENIFRQLATLRACMFDIDDFRAGRMQLAYVQLVQVLVDSLMLLSPFALYPECGILSVPLVGILTLFFKGLLSLSKSFLDPFGVEGYQEQNIRVDVLVSELNFGASSRWIRSASYIPPTPAARAPSSS